MLHKKFMAGLLCSVVVACIFMLSHLSPGYAQDGKEHKPLQTEAILAGQPNFQNTPLPLIPPPNTFMGNVLVDQTVGVNIASALPHKSSQIYRIIFWKLPMILRSL